MDRCAVFCFYYRFTLVELSMSDVFQNFSFLYLSYDFIAGYIAVLSVVVGIGTQLQWIYN